MSDENVRRKSWVSGVAVAAVLAMTSMVCDKVRTAPNREAMRQLRPALGIGMSRMEARERIAATLRRDGVYARQRDSDEKHDYVQLPVGPMSSWRLSVHYSSGAVSAITLTENDGTLPNGFPGNEPLSNQRP